MVSGFNAPMGQRSPVLITPVAAAQAAGVLRQALEQAGWQVIVAPNVASYASSAQICIVIVSPQTASDPEVSAAINAHFPTLIPVMTTPMPVPFGQWSVAPVLLGAAAAQQQATVSVILQTLARLAPSPAPSAPSFPAQPATPSTPYYPPAAPTPPAYAAPPSMPMYGQQPAPPSMPMYGQQPYGQPAYGQPAYGQPGAYPSITAKKSGMPPWAIALIVVGVIGVLAVGVYAIIGHGPSVGGQWDMTVTFLGNSSPEHLSLTQNGSSLSGTFTNPSGQSIDLTGSINGQNITLNGTYNAAALTFTGTVASDSQHMNGSLSVSQNGVQVTGSWTASRSQSGSGKAPEQQAVKPMITSLHRSGGMLA